MKHYLDLVPISAKIHKKQSRMSIFCIVLAVFLVTTIFGMADMFIRSQILQAQQESGNWHIAIKNISNEEAAIIASRPDIEVFSPYGVLNYRGDLGYTLGGKDVAICGCDESYITEIWTDQLEEGVFPQTSNEALVTENAKQIMGVAIGDPIAVETPDGDKLNFTISGFMNNTASIMSGDSYGIILNTEDYCAIYPNVSDGEPNDYGIMFFTQFANTRNIQGKIADLKEQCNLSNEQISSNNNLLGLLGQSRVPFLLQVYLAAAVLFVLVMLAGIMMIASSLNSNVAQRTEFFGLMRCIGATPKQIMRLVRKEALSWCRLAIPVGISIGIVVIWVLCAILRFLSPEFFKAMSTFGFSVPSILAGIVVGLVTVLFAAYSPAKKAAKVSPLAAVSGNANDLEPARNAANTQLLKIDTALGIYHAKANRKNLFLMTSSFALSIILFLSFSVTVEFMQHTLTPLQPWTADLSIISPDNACAIDKALLDDLKENPVVDLAYGRKFAYEVPSVTNGIEKKMDLISYEQYQFDWAKDYLLEGSLESVQTDLGTGLIVYNSQNTIQIGDTVSLNTNGQSKEIQIVGMLSDCPFYSAAGVGTIICSEDTFEQITGESKYTVIDVQLVKGTTDEDVYVIRQMVDSSFTFADERMGNSSTMGTYYCFWLFIYGFLVLIAMITIFNIINSISMSVSARLKQYGAFRAIGVSMGQLSKMIVAEAFTYTILLVLIIYTIWGNSALMVSMVNISSDRIASAFSNFRIAQVSDLHNAEFGESNTELIELLSEHEPDIIVITGDLIDAGHTDIEIAFDFIKQAVQIAPVYFVTGNHEANFSHYDQFKTGLEASGVTVLEDEAIQLVHNNEMITLIGLSDSDFTIKGDMFNEAPAMVNTKLNSLIDDENSYTILLSHRPELFETYVCCGVDLVLCGHAHGGQFRLPFIGGLVAPNQGLFPKYDSGLYTNGKTNMVVSRGLGNSIIPFRFNNRPEVVLVELNTE